MAAFRSGKPVARSYDAAADEPMDAVVVAGAVPTAPAEQGAARWRTDRPGAPLVVALAADGATGEHVRLLGHDVDVVLPAGTHGRVVLATVLALLRWRAR